MGDARCWRRFHAGRRRGRVLALAVLVGVAALALPAAAAADEEPPDPGAPFDRPVTPPPDARLAANRGLWLAASFGLFAPLGGGRQPGGGDAVSSGWGLGNGLVLEGQLGTWYYRRPIGTDGPDDGALAIPLLVGARYRFVTLWRHAPVWYAAAHLGPVITKAWYQGPTATRAGFGLQAMVGVQIPLRPPFLVDCSFAYLLDGAGAPAAHTIMEKFGTGHAVILAVGLTLHFPKREPYDPLGLQKVRPPAP
ncbi:MAG: hypothetical protein HY906_15755 [Deltaproteobacteria bacterium]|nr:hypothetical protein [Deltaproteobacteria bacterium]